VTQEPDPGRPWRLGLVLATTIFTAALGVLFRNPQLTALAEALGCSLGLAWLWARISLAGLEVSRSAPAQASEDEWIRVTLTLRQTGPLPALRVELLDRFVADALFERADAVGRLERGQAVVLTFERPCARGRGLFSLGPVELTVQDPFGLFRLSRTVPLMDEVVVYPLPLSLQTLGLASELERAFRGEGSQPHAGQGTQLLGLRELRAGERASRIHWRASARLDRLVVMELEAPSRSEVVIFLDLDRGSLRGVGRGSNVEIAIRLAAAVAHFALERGHSCGLVGDDGTPHWLPPKGGARQRFQILDTLARLQPQGEVDFETLLRRGGARVPAGSCVVLLFNRYEVEPDTLTELWASWSRRGVRALVLVVDDRRLLAHQWAGERSESEEPVSAVCWRLGIPFLEVERAQDLEKQQEPGRREEVAT